MPTPPDRPDGSDDPLAVAEAVAAAPIRDTEPIRTTEPLRTTEPVERRTEEFDPARDDRDDQTEAGRPTVLVDDQALGHRETVKLPSQRRPPAERVRRAPLP